MIPIFIPVDKETMEAMSGDIDGLTDVFPPWLWLWYVLVAISFGCLMWTPMIFKDTFMNMRIHLPTISYIINDYHHIGIHIKAIQTLDLFFFYFLYACWNIMYISIQPEKLYTQLITAISVLVLTFITWIGMITIMS